MKNIRFFAAALALSVGLSAFADLAFRQHRYDSFQATPTEPNQIVFAGNSITNMHSWFEAFGSNQDVIGRGNSGGMATEILEHLESYIDSKPRKFFLMIGTNDISSGTAFAKTASDIKTICKRVRLESPETEVYLETILPRSANAKPDYERCNDILREFVAELNDPKLHLIDLSEVLAPLGNTAQKSTWTCWDGLHPRTIGYSAWCHHIQDYVGYPTVYADDITEDMQTNPTGLQNSAGGRAEQFAFYPVKEGDVLFYGDDTVHQGEWHELLRSNKVKDRGGFWGWGAYNLVQAKAIVKNSLENQAVKPAKIFLFYGVGGRDLTNYRAIIDEANTQAPEAEIYLVSLTPSANATNDAAFSEFNEQLQVIAQEKGCTYVDIYTPLKADMSKNIMNTNYVSGRGYIVIANELAKYIEGTNPVSLEEYETVYNNRAVRKVIGLALNKALVLEYGDNVGQVKESHRAGLEDVINRAVAMLDDPELTMDMANTMAAEITEVVNMAKRDNNLPASSTADAPIWYTLCSSRGNKPLTVTDGKLFAAASALGSATTSDNVWRFEKRADETYNIVNGDNLYINPTAAYNTQMSVQTTEPDRGFNISYSDYALGTFVIYTSNSQLNQTSIQSKVYNWYNTSGGTPDRGDQGCSWAISLYDGVVLTADKTPTQTGWYEIKSAVTGMTITNRDEMVNQRNQNDYALQYALDPEPSPRNWVYMEVDGANCYITTHNGFNLTEYATAGREPVAYTFVASAGTPGAFDCKYWLPFDIVHQTSGENVANVVGRSYSAVTPHFFQRIADDKVAEYDVWKVEFVGDTNGSIPENDAKVTIASDKHHGLQTVFHNGTFFLEKGTSVKAADVQVTHPRNVNVANTNPKISVNTSEKTITIDYDQTHAALEELKTGWYEIKSAVTGMTITNMDDLTLQNNQNNYSLQYVLNPEPSPKNWIYMEFDGENCYFRTHSGFYLDDRSVCAHTPAAYTFVESTATPGAYDCKYWIPFNNTDSNTQQVVPNVLGRSSRSVVAHYFRRIPDEEVANYDLWTVNLVGDTKGSLPEHDTKVTIPSDNHHGLQTVFHNGTYFVEKGTNIAASDVNITHTRNVNITNENPKVTVDPDAKQILVDYNDFNTSGIAEINEKPKAAKKIFDLWGRRVATPRHGLYIVNGRKVRL